MSGRSRTHDLPRDSPMLNQLSHRCALWTNQPRKLLKRSWTKFSGSSFRLHYPRKSNKLLWTSLQLRRLLQRKCHFTKRQRVLRLFHEGHVRMMEVSFHLIDTDVGQLLSEGQIMSPRPSPSVSGLWKCLSKLTKIIIFLYYSKQFSYWLRWKKLLSKAK